MAWAEAYLFTKYLLVLLQKLRAHGITGSIINWIDNWLADKEQRVVINGICSRFTAVISGVPQGSILGTLLFIIFTNDMDDGVQLNSTQRASMDAGVKTPHVHIYLVSMAYRYYNQLISRTDNYLLFR